MAKEPFQQEVDRWLIACFGEKIARDKTERNHRFLEEALELVQSGGCTASEAHQLVDYVYNRPIGEMHQEVGGVMNTLAALCLAYGLDMVECGNVEIARCWTKVEKIRAKQAAKPKHSPLPEHVPTPEQAQAVKLIYTNWRGETAERSIIPLRVWYGSTEWHPEPQWLLRAIDTDKKAERDFALKDFGAALSTPPEDRP